MKPFSFKQAIPAQVLYWLPATVPPKPGLSVMLQYKGKHNYVTYHTAWHDGEVWHFHDCTKIRKEKYIQQWANVHAGLIIESTE